jgi:hypothetical protein
MAEEKNEAFVARWSRLKKEAENLPETRPDAPAPARPSLDGLTPQSDFKGFMHPQVEDALRRVALKKLFSDPHFNVPDPFEPFSGDWTVGEPISEKMLASLEQMKQMLKKPPEEAPAAKAEISQEEKSQEKPQPDEPGRKDA